MLKCTRIGGPDWHLGEGLSCDHSGSRRALRAALSTAAPAQDRVHLPEGDFYAAAGASFNGDRFDQALRGVSGVTNVFIGPKLIADGRAGGHFYDYDRDETAFAPDFQLGYFETFDDSAWQAGPKLTYKYANTDSRDDTISIPQAGSFTTLSVRPGPFYAVIGGKTVGVTSARSPSRATIGCGVGRRKSASLISSARAGSSTSTTRSRSQRSSRSNMRRIARTRTGRLRAKARQTSSRMSNSQRKPSCSP
jgi:hypothetical protein